MEVLLLHLLIGIFQARDILYLDVKTQDVKYVLDFFISICMYFHSAVTGKKKLYFIHDVSIEIYQLLLMLSIISP